MFQNTVTFLIYLKCSMCSQKIEIFLNFILKNFGEFLKDFVQIFL